MKIKTSTRISIIFSVFTFFIVATILIFVNIFSFFSWYNEERGEIIVQIDSEYDNILAEYEDTSVQRDLLLDALWEMGGFFGDAGEKADYKHIFLDLFIKENQYYILYKKETKFGDVFVSYENSQHYTNQLKLLHFGVLLLFIFTIFSFIISKVLFIKLALKDILYVSKNLENIDLNNIKKIKLDLNKNDEINIIVRSINHFLSIIEKNTKSLKEFNSQVAHEFKTPLMVISTELEYLSISGKNKDIYVKIEEQIDILNELLETFLFISKIENFKGNIKKDTIDIFELVKHNLDNLNIIYKEKDIKIIKKVKKNINIKTNKELFDILIKNILDNAFKYNKNKGKIKIIYDDNSLVIKDTGVGIKDKDIPKIFDSFYRVYSDKKGYGVGLNIVYKIVNILGYKIKVKSKKDKGTEFKIIF